MDASYSAGVRRYVEQANEYLSRRQAYREKVRKLKFDTIAVHGMYSVEEAFQKWPGRHH